MNVLIVEPSESYRHVLEALFREYPLETVLTSSGKIALERINAGTFDLVCTALHLEDMSGMDFCEHLRCKLGLSLSVIMLTSTEEKDVLKQGMKAGVTEIFRKSDLEKINDYLSNFVDQVSANPKLKGRVLYAEDNLSVARLTQQQVEQIGLQVDHFERAEEALQRFQECEYELVMTDILLAGHMSGLTLIREIRQTKGKKGRTPILAVSGFDDASRKIELLKSGANDYVSKPVLEEELNARVRNLVLNKQLLDRVAVQQKRLREMALTDQLTNLYNRHFLADQAPKRIIEAQRHKIPLSLFVIDLDYFKLVNDQFGHDSGDLVLVKVADVIQSACRKEDIAARFGGEEFVLILPHCDAQKGKIVAERLRKKIEGLDPKGIHITASIGVTALPFEKACSFEELFAAADQAVYEAKESGRNCVVLKEVP